MLLAVDVGNTQTVFGLFDRDRLVEHWRVATEAERTADELAALVGRLFELRGIGFDAISGVCLATAVPALVRSYTEFAERYVGAPVLVVGPGTRTGVPVRYDNPHEVGPDRVVNAVAAREHYGAPCIVVDFGTSTNFDAVSAAGEYVGGVLAPGIEVSMEALFSRAARLTKVDFQAPERTIGSSTTAALQAGIVFGFAGQVDGIVDRMRAELGDGARVIATGGLAHLIAPHSRTIELVDKLLTLEGLRLIWERNADEVTDSPGSPDRAPT
jgi:type III pantothenate kinase